ncbi:MAG: 1,4-dihydroxy-2-naphthoyl-CoA hydrolase [Algoriphagus sp.]|jgi:1,4-dihydroxy-2-naphthoyl-CoA hydrolase
MNLTRNLEMLNAFSENTLVEHIGIEFIDSGKEYLLAKMPVDNRTKQPYGILHGGASVVLGETLGSVASTLVIEGTGLQVVGLEINANYVRAVSEGFVYGKVTPIHTGRKTHIWEIKIKNEDDKLVSIIRFTCMIIEPLA